MGTKTGVADVLRAMARARKRGWLQEEYPEGSGIKLTRYVETTVPPGVMGLRETDFTARRTVYVIFFENIIVAFRLREDLDPHMSARQTKPLTRPQALAYLEEYGEDPDFLADPHTGAGAP